MNINQNERDLRSLFDELKAADARQVPPFTSPVSRDAVLPLPRGSSRRLGFVLTTGSLALLALAIIGPGVFRSHDISIKEEQQWAAFSNWEATTDTLLVTSSTRFGGILPESPATVGVNHL